MKWLKILFVGVLGVSAPVCTMEQSHGNDGSNKKQKTEMNAEEAQKNKATKRLCQVCHIVQTKPVTAEVLSKLLDSARKALQDGAIVNNLPEGILFPRCRSGENLVHHCLSRMPMVEVYGSYNPQDVAEHGKHYALIQLLCQHSANLQYNYKSEGIGSQYTTYSLLQAAIPSSPAITRFLLQQGAPIFCTLRDDNPLYKAIDTGFLSTSSALYARNVPLKKAHYGHLAYDPECPKVLERENQFGRTMIVPYLNNIRGIALEKLKKIYPTMTKNEVEQVDAFFTTMVQNAKKDPRPSVITFLTPDLIDLTSRHHDYWFSDELVAAHIEQPLMEHFPVDGASLILDYLITRGPHQNMYTPELRTI